MQLIFDTYNKTKNLHHAYLIEGNISHVRERLHAFIENDLGITLQNNPDIWQQSFEKMGINEGKMLRNVQTSKAVGRGAKRIFIVDTQFFTHEAQNSLLKVFEEPSPDVHFFIITPRADVLLPTLRSRFFIVSKESVHSSKKNGTIEVKAFMSADVQKRLEMVAPVIELKDKVATLAFLDDIESILVKQGEKVLRENSEILEDMLRCRRYLYGNAPSVKMILENLVVTLPRIAEIQK
jgi:DNA polymerase III delta prime subunit